MRLTIILLIGIAFVGFKQSNIEFLCPIVNGKPYHKHKGNEENFQNIHFWLHRKGYKLSFKLCISLYIGIMYYNYKKKLYLK